MQPQHAVQPQQTAQLQYPKEVIDAYKAEIITLYEARKALGFGETLVYFEPQKEEKQKVSPSEKALLEIAEAAIMQLGYWPFGLSMAPHEGNRKDPEMLNAITLWEENLKKAQWLRARLDGLAQPSQVESRQDEKQAAPQEGAPREEAPWDELERHIAEESQFLSDLFGVPVKVVVRKHG